MLTIEGLMAVLGFALTCIGFGFALGRCENNHTQK